MELSRIGADRFNGKTLLRIASILAEILLSSQIQNRQEFHAHDSAKGIIRRHQQSPSLARSQIDKSKVGKVEACLLRQAPDHFVEKGRFRWLIRGVENSQEPITPTNASAGRVDAMFPIVFGVTKEPSSPFRSRIANKLKQRAH